VATADFFTPIVDDPGDWGRIAAANALSDVYAMGATPTLALNLVSWPVDDLSLDLLADVLRGGAEVVHEAGAVILGGHTITDPEPKYGMAVIGFAHPDLIVRNATAVAGAELILTKPIGTGMISTAIKAGRSDPEQVQAAVEAMTTLNAAAAAAMLEAGVDAATDVTGFGLLGHLHGMLVASGVGATIDASAVPLLPGVLALARRKIVPSGTRRNLEHLSADVRWGDLTEPERLVLADAQTSGGLLIASRDAEALERALVARGVPAARVGTTTAGEPGRIAVTGRVSSED
jgi:selenide,water dikinase